MRGWGNKFPAVDLRISGIYFHEMTVSVALMGIPAVCLLVFVFIRRKRDRSDLERHSMTAEELHALREVNQDLLIFDVRQPLDLLAYPEIIPSAQRIPPTMCWSTRLLFLKTKTRWFIAPARAIKPAAKYCGALWLCASFVSNFLKVDWKRGR